MKLHRLIACLVLCVTVVGCAPQKPPDPAPPPQVVVRESGVAAIHSCLDETRVLSRKELGVAYAEADKQAESGAEADVRRLTCLSFHERATFQQFRRGLELLTAYAEAHPEEMAGLNGLLVLLRRLDQERGAGWVQRRKQLEAEEQLTAENRQLAGRIKALEQQAEQDQARIKELQQQIEQLKNIENIIKNRER